MAWWSKSFDRARLGEAKKYYKSGDYRERASKLMNFLDKNNSTLKSIKVAFGGSTLMSSYDREFRKAHGIEGCIKRPFSQEIIDWLGDRMIIWTSDTRENIIKKLKSAGLKTETARIIDREEYQEASINRMKDFDVLKAGMIEDLIRTKRIPKAQIKLPSVLGIDYLIDGSTHQRLSPCFDEDKRGYISVSRFNPMNERDFSNDFALAEAMSRLVEQVRGEIFPTDQ